MTTYTTGRAAKICGLGIQTVLRACDRGDLPSFRIPTGVRNEHRRITEAALREWAARHGIPIESDRTETAACPASAAPPSS